MSSPFGSPFGAQQNIVGGSTSEQSVAPVFGQQSVFGQTTAALGFPTPTLSTPAIFSGQHQTQPTAAVQVASTPQSNIFSNQSTSVISPFTTASTASSVFVQGSACGQASAQAGSSLFNKPPSDSTQGAQNVFGGTSLGVGSGNTTGTTLGTNAPSLFGVPGQSVAFQSTTMFTPSTFGQTTTPQSNFTTPTPVLVFGGPGHVKRESSPKNVAATLFGKQSSATVGNVATAPNAFGQLPGATVSNLATTNVFGKPATPLGFSQSTQSVYVKDEDTKPALFGAGEQATTSAGNQDMITTGLFGKVKQEATESGETKPGSSALFGDTRIKQENMFGDKAGSDSAHGTRLFWNERPETSVNKNRGLFGKGKPDSRGAQETGLFGKGKPDSSGDQGAGLFGKGNPDSSGAQGAELFGKGKRLFGKPNKKEEDTKGLNFLK